MTTHFGRVFAYCKKLDRDFGWERFEEMPFASQLFLLRYGWKQWQADSHAGTKRDNFPTGAAGTEAYQDRVLKDIEERMTAIETGIGLPGEPKPDAAKELAKALVRIAELEAQVTGAMDKAA